MTSIGASGGAIERSGRLEALPEGSVKLSECSMLLAFFKG